MHNSIDISYPENSLPLTVSYNIELAGEIQTINCNVEGARFPVWLQLRKFSMSSLKKQGTYTPLFNEVNNSKNMDTSLFIDLVYDHIMGLERLLVGAIKK